MKFYVDKVSNRHLIPVINDIGLLKISSNVWFKLQTLHSTLSSSTNDGGSINMLEEVLIFCRM